MLSYHNAYISCFPRSERKIPHVYITCTSVTEDETASLLLTSVEGGLKGRGREFTQWDLDI